MCVCACSCVCVCKRVCVCTRWISVLSNSKQEALSVALDGGRSGGRGGGENSLDDLTRAITDDIRRMPGNNVCCDCGAPGQKHTHDCSRNT